MNCVPSIWFPGVEYDQCALCVSLKVNQWCLWLEKHRIVKRQSRAFTKTQALYLIVQSDDITWTEKRAEEEY